MAKNTFAEDLSKNNLKNLEKTQSSNSEKNDTNY
jgi:hypothetical protein